MSPTYGTTCLEFKGLSEDLQSNVRTRLSTLDADDVHVYSSWLNDVVREELRALGYYSPTIDFELRPALNSGCDVLITNVDIGKPITITGVNVVLRGDACLDIDYQQWVKLSKPALGSILNHRQYDNFKSGFSSLALRKGYFNAAFYKSQLSISPIRYQAYWDIDFDSGKRYRFGKVRFHGTQISEDYLQNIDLINLGASYSLEALAIFYNSLVASNLFKSVIISPDFQDNTLLLDTMVTQCLRNKLEIGLGYSNDLGLRLKTLWHKPWLNSRGHSMKTSINLPVPEQVIEITYKIPLFHHYLEQYYLLQGRFKLAHINYNKSELTTLNVIRYWDISNSWQRAIHLRWSMNHFTEAKINNTTMLIYPSISMNRTRQRGGIMSTWGDSQRYSLSVSTTTWGSNVNFLLLQAQNVWIRTLAEKYRFVMRSHLGWIETNNFENIPPTLLFFAGGDHSIRGYKYQSLSPRNNYGKLTGALKLARVSLEYQYHMIGKWWGAVFIDSGEAVNDITQSNIRTGAGIGMRWQSPVGLFELDLATPVADKCEHGLQLYIGFGPEL
ncbi:autotransporter assembly complex protein TamA [Candidatus Palibaumannia cicadellinicola]|nr:autotransporter assembly complex family protein [Candidatus Baumannia cicadellinicola]